MTTFDIIKTTTLTVGAILLVTHNARAEGGRSFSGGAPMPSMTNSNYGGINNTSFNRAIINKKCGFTGIKWYSENGIKTTVEYRCGKVVNVTQKSSQQRFETTPVENEPAVNDTNNIKGRG